NLNNLI
ncbi:DNA topoisomerase 1, partial [Haemophilus influenzae]